jgi:hypothetical protein
LSSSAQWLAAPRPGASLPSRRWIALIALLLAELLALTVSFDGGSLARGVGSWSSWLGRSSEVQRVAIAAVVATFVFGGGRLRAEWLRQVDADHRPRRFWSPLLLHLAAFGLFAWVTAFVFQQGLDHSASPGGWAFTWLMTGLAAFACWAAAAVPATTEIIERRWSPDGVIAGPGDGARQRSRPPAASAPTAGLPRGQCDSFIDS